MQVVAKRHGAEETEKASRPFAVRLIRWLWVLVALAVAVVFAVALARLTLRPVHGAGGQVHDNPHPGATLRFYLDRPSVKEAVVEIGGNLALLMPLGVLLPILFDRLRGLVRLTLAAALISLAIEVVQGLVLTGRSFDVDDVILNTVGAVIAYLIVGRRFGRWAHPG
ncbi:VanZ family protein [Actinoallomurus spadix]|uniref:VanZ-like domain-containing protein n=1 Tax=Actinoallomurus spadix TaxID=79912 RepID=A0ABN0VQA4_9ACTN|nr:VanZ family protein [Actinoallomurus spadix]MCO5990777.1 VanZ family protein [Actinoallomurus spadix]